MTHVGIDLEQFVTDPHGSGIQRVLQYLAKEWPAGEMTAEFVVPWAGGHALLTREQAADLLTTPFLPRGGEHDLREPVLARIAEFDPATLTDDELNEVFDAWLLGEVSYLPTVLRRFEDFAERVPTVMIGYDTLPMSEPANYRFRPGVAPWASEYFRLLATSRSVVCISAAAKDAIMRDLRRDPALPISVTHPGGDHVPIRAPEPPDHPLFMRLGTLEARKRPVEIAQAFRAAREAGNLDAELLFVGGHSHSDEGINRAIRDEVEKGGVRWIEGASDAEVEDLMHRSSAFLSIGVEGYGIPVLEAIRLGTPVLYDGMQPAAELMQGRGAERMDAMSHEGMAQAFQRWSAPEALSQLRAELDPESVPTWSAFAKGVVEAFAD
ncbi:MAG: glycosyltransferase [Candidatus Nanopelagicales bacterium]|nr:glycosyltransferase [Candidatus Nanopelagicales bacterium]MCF8536808.1 glycosyltransferase [Candidatus Nanopelagicales bacterium]MCF8541793.1 glycosyltransferase [Candidatus Nanopelagicales bacterium]MCF8556166.1 glycosyltransferase [Candidatus Nanopelagicales bacterium]